MKYFVFSDIHGYYSLLENELNKHGFDFNNPNHMLISLGDNFDRGPESIKMYEFLKKMKANNKIILVKGNHEELFLSMMYRREVLMTDISNGTFDTALNFIKLYFEDDPTNVFKYRFSEVYHKLNDEGILDFFYDMLDYYETKDYVFVHGFIPIDKEKYQYIKDWRTASDKQFYNSRWLNGLEMSIQHNLKEESKKIVVGHYRTSYGNLRKKYPNKSDLFYKSIETENIENFAIYEDDNIIAIDGCTHISKRVNVFVFEDK